MEISKTWSPAEAESKWYKYWLDNKFFSSKPNPNKEPYTIVIPPPNVTGVLHMGHMLNNTIQDILVRKARMQGKEACWVPGTDHASIATEAKVVAMLAEKGIQKKDLTREQFLEYAWEWKEKYGGIILEQLKKLGCSCDWDRTRFTMEPALSDAVIQVFVDLYNKGLIYRGARMVNWDPKGKTALSDEEVYYKEVDSKLVYVRYPIVGEANEYITIATTRPETILGDTAVCVNPDDERYKHLVGKYCIVPIVNRKVPIIADSYVDKDFGTGALKVTPAHDINDYELGVRHRLETIDILNDDGTLSEAAGHYIGQDRFAVRKQIVKDLAEQGYVVKEEAIKNKVGYSERTHAVIEPKISTQWFLKMEALAKPALENVMNDNIQLHPPKFKNMYRSWMENVHDWCISRQLWWGHQIPAFYLMDGTVIVAKSKKEALRIARDRFQLYALSEVDLRQDEDVLDTWFSSWLWPISVFDGFANPNGEDIQYYYPTNDLVTAPEILFFWVARMIMAGYEYRQAPPFKNVYLTGIVRDKQGRKMSKSLGNSPEPLELIEKYGADGVRVGMLFSSPAGNDLLFDEKLCEQGRNFANKIWNAFRLTQSWTVSKEVQPSESDNIAVRWFEQKLNHTLHELETQFNKFRLSEALNLVYKLVWDDFCSWYLEMIKPPYGTPVSQVIYAQTKSFFERLLAVLHPFMPFITEEIWHLIEQRNQGDSLCVAPYPIAGAVDAQLLETMQTVIDEAIVPLRMYRNQNQLAAKDEIPAVKVHASQDWLLGYAELVKKLTQTAHIIVVNAFDSNDNMLVGKRLELGVPALRKEDPIEAKERLVKELEYTKGFLQSVSQKLSNERFIANAKPEIVDKEKAKKADAESKIKALEAALAKLGV
jgi:valyl-tRNA synthetase